MARSLTTRTHETDAARSDQHAAHLGGLVIQTGLADTFGYLASFLRSSSTGELSSLELEDEQALARKRAELTHLCGVHCTRRGVVFMQPPMGAAEIFIAGDFNHWDATRHPMRFDPVKGAWRRVIDLPPGRYRYRLVIDGDWQEDRFNRAIECNPFGEFNNVVDVPARS